MNNSNYLEIMNEFDLLADYHTVGCKPVQFEPAIALYYKNTLLKRFETLKEAMQFALEHNHMTNQSEAPRPEYKRNKKRELVNSYYVASQGDITLETFDDLSEKEAIKTVDFLFDIFGTHTKSTGEFFNKWDVYPNIKKMIDQGSITLQQAQIIGLKYNISAGVVEMRINDLY